MDRNLFVVGVIVLVIGLVLSFAFWPIFGTTPESLYEDRDGLIYESYEREDTVLVHGTITNVRIDDFPGWMEDLGFRDAIWVELDEDFSFVIRDETSIDYSEGDSIYARLTLREESLILGRIEYWEMTGSLGNKQLLNVVFYVIAALGAVITVVGVIKS